MTYYSGDFVAKLSFNPVKLVLVSFIFPQDRKVGMGHFKRKENPQFTPPYSDITCGPFKKKKDTYRGAGETHMGEQRKAQGKIRNE